MRVLSLELIGQTVFLLVRGQRDRHKRLSATPTPAAMPEWVTNLVEVKENSIDGRIVLMKNRSNVGPPYSRAEMYAGHIVY